MQSLIKRLKKVAEHIRIDCDRLDTNYTDGEDFDAVQEAISALEAVDGKVLMPIQPVISSAMKGEHLGEHSLNFPLQCPECEPGDPETICGICKGEGEYMQQINIPWTVCKKIFHAMYATAVKEALPAPPKVEQEG